MRMQKNCASENRGRRSISRSLARTIVAASISEWRQMSIVCNLDLDACWPSCII
jgi:hypothetical protein